jgi:hypothetical protein
MSGCGKGSEDLGRKISFTLSANRLTFSNRSGGAFSIPVRTETTTAADEPPHAGHDEQRQRMSFAEWCDAVDDRQKKCPTP